MTVQNRELRQHLPASMAAETATSLHLSISISTMWVRPAECLDRCVLRAVSDANLISKGLYDTRPWPRMLLIAEVFKVMRLQVVTCGVGNLAVMSSDGHLGICAARLPLPNLVQVYRRLKARDCGTSSSTHSPSSAVSQSIFSHLVH